MRNWRGMPTILGENSGRREVFFGGGAWNPGETRPKNSRKNVAGEIRWEIRRQFSYNSPDQLKKFTPNPLCRTSGSKLDRSDFNSDRSDLKSPETKH